MIKFDIRLWNVSELIIEEINLNNSSNNIEISDYHTLQSIVFKNTAFKSLNQSKFLRISNNNHLKIIIFEEPNDKNVLEYISKVELADLPQLETVTFDDNSFYKTKELILQNLPQLETVTFDDNSFYNTKELILQNLPQLETIIFGKSCFCNIKELILQNLPQLKTVIFGKSSFCNTKEIILNNLPQLITITMNEKSFENTSIFSLVKLPELKEFTTKRDCCINLQSLIIQETPFKDGKYTHGEGSFYRLLPHHITVDDSLSDLYTQICPYLLDLPIISNDDNNPLVWKTNPAVVTNNNISDNNEYTSILVETGYFNNMDVNVEFKDYPSVLYLYIQLGSYKKCSQLVITNMNKLRVIAIEKQCFTETKIVKLINLPSLTECRFGNETFENTKVLNLYDLPVLSKITIELNCLRSRKTTDPIEIDIKNVPFTNGKLIVDNKKRRVRIHTKGECRKLQEEIHKYFDVD